MKTTKNTAQQGAGEAAALNATPYLYDYRPLAKGNEADTLLMTAGVLPTGPSEHHLSKVLCLNRDAEMQDLCEAIRLRAQAVRGTLALLQDSEAIDEAHRAAAAGAGLLVDELCGLAAAIELAMTSYDLTTGASA